MTHLVVAPLTEAAFRPYGQLLGRPAREADIAKGWLRYWHTLSPLGFSRTPVWGFLEVNRRPFQLTELERHSRSHEVFIPLGQGISIMPVALGGVPGDPGANPDLTTLRLFLINGDQALVIPQGVWHTPAYPVTPSAGFLLALEEDIPATDIDSRLVGPYAFEYDYHE